MTSLSSHRKGRAKHGASGASNGAKWQELASYLKSHPAWTSASFERQGESRYKITGAPCALRCGYQFAPLDVEALEEWLSLEGLEVGAGEVRRAIASLAKDNGASVASKQAPSWRQEAH